MLFSRKKSAPRGKREMQVRVQDCDSGCTVSVSGRITIDSSPELLSFLLQNVTATGRDTLTLDLWEVEYIDTSALAVFLEALRAARQLRRTFHLSGLRDRPRYLLEAIGFMSLFSEARQETSS